MNRAQTAISLSLLSVAALTGCSGFGAASFPDAAANPAQIPIGTIQGSNFGGHAPLVGAHIYLVEPSTTAYGGVVKGLLTATSANPSFPTTQNGSWANGPTATTSTLTEFNNAGSYLVNLNFPGQNNTRGAQVDPSGNVWVIENQLTTDNLIEIVGAAAPVVTPIMPGQLGVRP